MEITEKLIIETIIRAVFWFSGFWFLYRIHTPDSFLRLPLPLKSKSTENRILNQNIEKSLIPEKGLKISIIIPARNEEKNIANLLDSIFSQELNPELSYSENSSFNELTDSSINIEVLVVNDQSIDATEEIARKYDVKVINIDSLPKGWLGKTWACYSGAEQATGDLLLFVDADAVFEKEGLFKIISAYKHASLGDKSVVSIQPYHKIKRFYENFASFFNLIMMGSMNIFTPLGFRLKPIGAFGPCLVVERDIYFSIGGHSSTKKDILEDLQIGKKFIKNNIYVYCMGGRKSISFRMYPDGLGSLVNGFSKGFSIGASSTTIMNLILIILWIAAAFYPITLLIESAVNFAAGSFNLAVFIIGISFYIAYAAQLIWMLKRIGNFSIMVGLFFPVFLVFFVIVFFWSIIRVVFKLNIRWKGRTINK